MDNDNIPIQDNINNYELNEEGYPNQMPVE